MAVQFGVSVPQGWTMDLVEIADPEEKYEAMTRAAQEADRLGYDSIWLFDHFHIVPTPELETTFECLTSLAGLARDTHHVKLGQMAVCNGYRNPALLAKIGAEEVNYFIFYLPSTGYDLSQMQRVASQVLPHFRQF